MADLPKKHIVVTAIVDGSSVLAVQVNTQEVEFDSGYGSMSNVDPLSLCDGFTFSFTAGGMGNPSRINITVKDPAYWSGAGGSSDWRTNETKAFKADLSGASNDTAYIDIHLRAIPKDFLVVKNGTSGLQLASVGGNQLTISSGGSELTFSGTDVKTVAKPAAALWSAADAEFDCTISMNDGGDYVSQSEFTTSGQRPNRCLRQLTTDSGTTDLTGYTMFRNQTAGGNGINNTLPLNTDILVTPGGANTPSFNDNMGITGVTPTPASWDGAADTTFNLKFRQVLVSGSDYLLSVNITSILVLHFREFDGADASYFINIPSGSGDWELKVNPDGTNWDWQSFTKTAGVLTASTPALPLTSSTSLVLDFTPVGSLSDTAVVDITLQRTDKTHPLCTAPISFAVHAVTGVITFTENLPTATEGATYSGSIIAGGFTTGNTLKWIVSGLDMGFTSVQNGTTPEQLDITSGSVPTGILPEGFAVELLEIDTSGAENVEVGYGKADFSINEAVAVDKEDVAILIDRSGSMNSYQRWSGAINGAHCFAQLVSITSSPTDDHQVGIMWFGGWGSPSQINYDHTTPGPDGDYNVDLGAPYDGGKNFGTLKSSATEDLDFEKPDSNYLNRITASETFSPPHYWTAVGSGFMHARDRLMARSADRGRTILCLSDGEENRIPDIQDVFVDDGGALWKIFGEPNTRIFSIALGTTPAWVSKLQTASIATGGSANDVKDAADLTTAVAHFQAWFQNKFATIFGWTPGTATDPTIGSGDFGEETVTITEAFGEFIFTACFNEKLFVGDSSKWHLAVIPPGSSELIIDDQPNISFLSGPMYLMVHVKLPVEQYWPGEWKIRVYRDASGSGSYTANSILKPDNDSDEINTEVNTEPVESEDGETVGVEVTVEVSEGDEPADADVVIEGTQPDDEWPDEVVAKEAENQDPEPDDDDNDEEEEADTGNRLQELLKKVLKYRRFKPIPISLTKCRNVGRGKYRARFRTRNPGQYIFKAIVEGERKSKLRTREYQNELKNLSRKFTGAHLRHEMEIPGKETGKQKYHVESTCVFNVSFVPSLKNSKRAGYMLKNGTIRLMVTPRNARGTLLGPGWGHKIRFQTPLGRKRLVKTQDALNGNYLVEIPVKLGKEISHDVMSKNIWSDHVSLKLGEGDKWIPDYGSSLRLRKFGVRVLGVFMPITVRGKASFKPGIRPGNRMLSRLLREILNNRINSVRLSGTQAKIFKKLCAVLNKSLPAGIQPGLKNGISVMHGIKRAFEEIGMSMDELEKSELKSPLSSLSAALNIMKEKWSNIHDYNDSTVGPFFDDVTFVCDAAIKIAKIRVVTRIERGAAKSKKAPVKSTKKAKTKVKVTGKRKSRGKQKK